jgi:hypothetical protein
MPQAKAPSPALRLDLVNAKLSDLRRKFNQSEMELFKSQMWYRAEEQRSQTFQQGFQVQQQKCIAMSEQHDHDMAIVQQDLELAERLIATQKEIIDYQGQQQQPASHHIPGGPLLSQYNDQPYQPYQSYQPLPRGPEFVIDPAGLDQLDDYQYGIGTSNDTQPVTSAPVAEFEHRNFNLSSILHPVSAERDVPIPADISKGAKKSSEDEGGKSNKKRKTK